MKIIPVLVAALMVSGSLHVHSKPMNSRVSVAVESNISPLIEELMNAKELELSTLSTSNIAESMISRDAKVGISSRKWTDIEMARFNQRYGYRPTELLFTADVVAIIANEDNAASSVTLAELKGVFGCSSQPEFLRWAQKDNSDDAVSPYMLPFAVDQDLTMHRKFSSWITCKDGEYVNTQYLATTEDLLEKVDSDESAIGYAVYSDQIEEAKWLSIVDDMGMTYDVNKETILSGRYPLANVYYMYLDLPPYRDTFTEQEKFFIGLTLSQEHQDVFNQFGFISLPEEAIHRNKVRLSLAEPIIEGGYK